MTTQLEALRLAELIDWPSVNYGHEAAAELRRLHESNQELLEALAWIANRCPVHLMDHPLHNIHKEMARDAGARARYATAKAEGRA